MILKQSKMINDHPDLLKLRRGLLEKLLSVLVMVCFIVIGFLTFEVFYYKNLAQNNAQDPLSIVGGKYLASIVSSKMNFSANPCDDFYNFACGRFEKNVIIPEDSGSVNTINMIEGRVMAQLQNILKSEINEVKDIRPFRLAKHFYQQCLNTSQIEKTGTDFVYKKFNLTKMWPILATDENPWNESAWKSHEFNRYLIDLFIDSDLKNATKRILYINDANLGLGRDFLLKGVNDTLVNAYYKYMVNLTVYFGANRSVAEEEIMKVLEFEIQLANLTLPKEFRRNSEMLYNPMKIKDLMTNYSYIDWLGYLNGKKYGGLTFYENDPIILQSISYYENLGELLERTDKSVIANYILIRDIADYVPYLNEKLRNLEFDFLKTVTGRATRSARWFECIKATTSMFNIAVSAMYIREHFRDEKIKKDVTKIYDEINSEFEKILLQNKWMDEKTKQEALKKLKSMNVNVAYPNELLNNTILEKYYEKLHLNATHYLESALNVDNHSKEFICSRYHEPVNRSHWIDSASTIYVNANYNGKGNSIQIIAALLQGHFYNADNPKYMNYGAVGYVIGHEITHGFDDMGRQYNSDGNLQDWWDPDTKKNFLEKTKCIIEQYGNYSDPITNSTLNGIITQGENIADNGGLKIAYRAYLAALQDEGTNDPLLPGLNFTQQQLFWISAAQTWCSVERPEYRKMMIATDPHSLNKYRVIGTLSNSAEFSQDFKCTLGSPMNPVDKCEVW